MSIPSRRPAATHQWFLPENLPSPKKEKVSSSNSHSLSRVFAVTLPETNSKSPWKWMVGILFPFAIPPIFRGENAVSFRWWIFVDQQKPSFKQWNLGIHILQLFQKSRSKSTSSTTTQGIRHHGACFFAEPKKNTENVGLSFSRVFPVSYSPVQFPAVAWQVFLCFFFGGFVDFYWFREAAACFFFFRRKTHTQVVKWKDLLARLSLIRCNDFSSKTSPPFNLFYHFTAFFGSPQNGDHLNPNLNSFRCFQFVLPNNPSIQTLAPSCAPWHPSACSRISSIPFSQSWVTLPSNVELRPGFWLEEVVKLKGDIKIYEDV